MDCEQKFRDTYRREPEGLSFCPYRVCPIGAHSDHQLGKITGFAIDKGIRIAYAPKQNGVIELASLQFDKRAQWHIRAVPEARQNDWADYLRGATLELSRLFPLRTGLSGVIEGSLPIGGLSSSAAVIIAFLKALCSVNGIHLDDQELISAAQAAENNYVGVSCGKLDQSCEVYSKKDHLLYLDTSDDSYELIPVSPGMKPFEIAVFFSGVERTLAGSKFNMRVDECRSAAYALKAYSGMEYGKFEQTNLRDVPVEVFHRFKDRLPDNWRKRAEHWYTEFDRVQRGAEAWRKGDIDEYGRLSFESGHSSIFNWETGSPELKKIYEIMCRTDGIYGGRFSGAGFKGCCMAIIDPSYEEEIFRKVESEYLAEFPAFKGRFGAYACHSADGVKV
ncbi:MAG: galactokinase [Bacteroidales bacterium]|nr:galactokinase [Bacteroidales bacterium]